MIKILPIQKVNDEVSYWYERAELCDYRKCTADYRCSECQPDGICDACDTIDGRWVQAVSDYASTCDGCAELTMHEEMEMDEETQLGYCQECQKLFKQLEDNK